MTEANNEDKLPGSILKVRDFYQVDNRVETILELQGKTWNVYFESDEYAFTPTWEALLPMLVLVGMRKSSKIQMEHGIDATLLANLAEIQERLSALDPLFTPVPIEGVFPAPPLTTHPSRVGLFFSGGVDSWYSFLVHQEEVTDLIWVSGCDIPLDNQAHLEKSIQLVRKVADHFGKRLVIMRTNIRSFTDGVFPFYVFQGNLMQSLSLLFQEAFSRIFFAAALNTSQLVTYGLDPVLIGLWSSSSLQLGYDGLEADRVQKVARLAQEPFALQNLRVCWKNPIEGLNCGVCEKCQRTMVNLEAVGALERCHAFNHPLDLKLISRVFIEDKDQTVFTQMNLDAILQREGNSPLARALRNSLQPPPWKRGWNKLKKMVKKQLRRLPTGT